MSSIIYNYYMTIALIALKVRVQRKIVDRILNTTEQHFYTNLNGVFSFSLSCFVLEILEFLKHAN